MNDTREQNARATLARHLYGNMWSHKHVDLTHEDLDYIMECSYSRAKGSSSDHEHTEITINGRINLIVRIPLPKHDRRNPFV
jgi:hypothetical protein